MEMESIPLSPSGLRVVVELDTLAKELSSCCQCRKKLELHNITGIKCKLLDTTALVQCKHEECLATNEVLTTVQSSSTEALINEDFQRGLITSGITVDQAKMLFSALRIPYVVPQLSRPSIKQELADEGPPCKQEDIFPTDSMAFETSSYVEDDCLEKCDSNHTIDSDECDANLPAFSKPLASTSMFEMTCENGGSSKLMPVTMNFHRTQRHSAQVAKIKAKSRVPYKATSVSKKQAAVGTKTRGKKKTTKNEAHSDNDLSTLKKKKKTVLAKCDRESLPDGSFSCVVCSKPFQRKSDLIRHEQTHTGVKPFQCVFCDKRFSRKATMDIHLRFHTGDRPFVCELCGNGFVSRARWRYHILHNRCKAEIRRKAEYPEEVAVEAKLLPSDKVITLPDTSEQRYICGFCCISCPSVAELSTHRLSHQNSKPFHCDICQRTFVYRSSLVKHLHTHPEHMKTYVQQSVDDETAQVPNTLKCPYCEELFTQEIMLRFHVQTHVEKGETKPRVAQNAKEVPSLDKALVQLSKEGMSNSAVSTSVKAVAQKPHKCSYCAEAFSRRFDLKRHEYDHLGLSPVFRCDICGKSFNRMNSLKVHIQSIHVGERPFKCTECGKRFKRRNALNCHRFVHKNERPFKCHICDMTFHKKDYLEEHTRVHTGEKPYLCSFCAKSFPSRKSLQHHERYHTGEKLHQCRFCERKFARTYTRTVHERTHTGERPYTCTLCSKRFALKKSMENHVAKCTAFSKA